MYTYAATEAQVVAQEFLTKINEAILFPLITLMMAIALLIFLYGAFEYVKGASNDGDRETGKRHLLYGTIGMLVMLSAMALLSLAAATFGLENELEDAQGMDSLNLFDRSPSGESFYSDRAPITNDYDEDPYEEDPIVDPVGGEEAEYVDDANNPFIDMETDSFAIQFQFYEDKINETYEGDDISANDVVSYFHKPASDYPADYGSYENSLLSSCISKGGSDVFSISVNNDTGRQFYCVR
jgi:hypothetical protein